MIQLAQINNNKIRMTRTKSHPRQKRNTSAVMHTSPRSNRFYNNVTLDSERGFKKRRSSDIESHKPKKKQGQETNYKMVLNILATHALLLKQQKEKIQRLQHSTNTTTKRVAKLFFY